MNLQFEAVIFDLDGTLIDTESLALATGMAAFERVGNPVDESFMHGLVGVDNPTANARIMARFPALDFERLHKFWREGFDRGIENDLQLKPGVAELLPALILPKAVATSSDRRSALYKIGRAGLAPHFPHVVSRDDVVSPKPAPDPFLHAAELLGVDPSRCLAFEDSEIGSQAAMAAGMYVIQVPDFVPATGQFAHHVAPDLLSGARHAGLI
ncbi:HAD family hydrolase [Neogemmobacter tilapiae]|uniref:Haloacid dehalogenase n=1 Tax=Neogemmobacter tilapiae TaxID=875041 RepID=A0A918TUY0_9RHOB|nr:HAD family phosphatase [Gemmobacter tilapiae]GHC63670.1 haloacid dehalogenase [Gemmobacter tilapiae]